MWKGIEGYDNYMVSSYGRVKNIKTGRILKPLNHSGGYLTVVLYANEKINTLYIHRLVSHAFLLNPLNRRCVDHRDHDKHNNNILNLRYASDIENGRNRGMHKNNTTNFKGIHRHGKKYRAQITNGGKKIHIGLYETKEEASEAYEARAKELFGEFYKPPISA